MESSNEEQPAIHASSELDIPDYDEVVLATDTAVEHAQQRSLIGLAEILSSPRDGADVIEYDSIANLLPLSELEDPKQFSVLCSIKDSVDIFLHANSSHLEPVLRHLADLCKNVEWRDSIAQAGFISSATDVLAALQSTKGATSGFWRSAHLQALRFVGNVCADTNFARGKAIEYNTLQLILEKFKDVDLVSVAVPAAFNICFDYDPAHPVAIEAGLLPQCLLVLETGMLRSSPAFSYLWLLLDIVFDIVEVKDAPPQTLDILLKTSLEGNLEVTERLTIIQLISKLLAEESNQVKLIETDKVDLVLGSLFRAFSEAHDPMDVVLSGIGQTTGDDPDEENELTVARKLLVERLADISAQPTFVEKYKIFTDKTMLCWKLRYVMGSPVPLISQVACLMLGNLASTDEICKRMVQDLAIHEAASGVLRSSQDIGVIHAVLGLLRNLAVSVENKSSLAMVGLVDSLQPCWTLVVNPQIQLAAASLMRQLINGSLSNVQQLVRTNNTINGNSGTKGNPSTQLGVLLEFYARTDELPIRTEIGRTVTAILRCVYSKDTEEDVRTAVQTDLYLQHTNLEQPLIGMILQTQYPVVRSEGWFGLGLISRSNHGQNMIVKHLEEPAVWDLLRSTVSGKHKPREVDENMAGTSSEPTDVSVTKDGDNALLVVHELLKPEMDTMLNEDLRGKLLQLLNSSGHSEVDTR